MGIFLVSIANDDFTVYASIQNFSKFRFRIALWPVIYDYHYIYITVLFYVDLCCFMLILQYQIFNDCNLRPRIRHVYLLELAFAAGVWTGTLLIFRL